MIYRYNRYIKQPTLYNLGRYLFLKKRTNINRMLKIIQHPIYYGGKSIYTGYDIGGWHCQHLDISFDNLL